jgi:hypothetical protein
LVNEIRCGFGCLLNQQDDPYTVGEISQIAARNLNDTVLDHGLELYGLHNSSALSEISQLSPNGLRFDCDSLPVNQEGDYMGFEGRDAHLAVGEVPAQRRANGRLAGVAGAAHDHDRRVARHPFKRSRPATMKTTSSAASATI